MCLYARARLRVQFPMERMADKHGVSRKYPGRNGNTPLSFHQKMNAYNSEQNRLRAIQGIHEEPWRNMSLMSIHVSKRLTRLHNVLARLQSTIAFVWCDIGMVEYRIKEEDQDLPPCDRDIIF